MPYLPRDAPATFRNATVQSVSGGLATVLMDGTTVAGLDVYGSVSAGQKAMVLVQGASMTVMGVAGGGGALACSQSVAAATAVTISTWWQSMPITGGVATSDSSGVTLQRGGWWSFQTRFSGWGGSGRKFQTIWVGSLAFRTPIWDGENYSSHSALVNAAAGTRVTVDVYQASGGFACDGNLWLKYLGG